MVIRHSIKEILAKSMVTRPMKCIVVNEWILRSKLDCKCVAGKKYATKLFNKGKRRHIVVSFAISIIGLKYQHVLKQYNWL